MRLRKSAVAQLFDSVNPSEVDKIDVRHHWVPQEYAEAIGAEGDPNGWPRPEWSFDSSEELMKRAGIKRSILLITAPGACILKGKQSWELAHTLNTKAAEIRDSKPDAFGFFLTLGNILDTDETLAEIAYGFDELEADGVCLFTRYDSEQRRKVHSENAVKMFEKSTAPAARAKKAKRERMS